MKIVFKLILFFLFFFIQTEIFASASNPINAYFFHGDGCPHCVKELKFLQEMQKEYPNLKIKSFEIYRNKENALLLEEIGNFFHVNIGGVPFLVIGSKYFVGFIDGVTSEEIKDTLKECAKKGCRDIVMRIMHHFEKQNSKQSIDTQKNKQEKIITLPILGKIDTYKISLLTLTVILGLLDGFNPCAMWTLLFLISLLLGMKDRKRMWILGSTFIIASAFVYFLFMSAWLNFFLFLGFIVWVRIVIGSVALLGGGYRLKEFLFNKESSCKVTGYKNREKVIQKLKSAVGEKSFWLALGGIIVLAFMVNLVELICSAGLPAVYTQVLALNALSTWQYYLYMLLYIFFYMLDDLLVFIIAMITLEITGLSTKYLKFSQLFGGVIMLIIGLLLIFKPEWLMFG